MVQHLFGSFINHTTNHVGVMSAGIINIVDFLLQLLDCMPIFLVGLLQKLVYFLELGVSLLILFDLFVSG